MTTITIKIDLGKSSRTDAFIMAGRAAEALREIEAEISDISVQDLEPVSVPPKRKYQRKTTPAAQMDIEDIAPQEG